MGYLSPNNVPNSPMQVAIQHGIPIGPLSKVYVVDPVNGASGNSGLSFESPLNTVEAAYALMTANRHDCLIQISGATADNPSAAITWSKDYTHWIGLSGDLPGVGQRARVVGTAALDLAQLVTFSGAGCIIKNLQFFNGADANSDSGAAIVSGSRNYFKNVFFAGMGHATPAARAGSYSLKVSSSENYFEDCTIGLDTIVRSAANSELMLTSGHSRNTFRSCRFVSISATAGKFLVSVDTTQDSRITSFEDCLFYNNSTNWGTQISNAFTIIGSGSTYYIDLARCRLVGPSGWSDVVTHLYSADPAPNAGFGVATTPTT